MNITKFIEEESTYLSIGHDREKKQLQDINTKVYDNGKWLEDEDLFVIEDSEMYISVKRYEDGVNTEYSLYMESKNLVKTRKMYIYRSGRMCGNGTMDCWKVGAMIELAKKTINRVIKQGMVEFDEDGHKITAIHYVRLNKLIKRASNHIVSYEAMFLNEEDDVTPTYKISLTTTDDFTTYELGTDRCIERYLKSNLMGLMEKVEITRMTDNGADVINLPGLVREINNKCLI